jgi:hypothetical protein
MPPLNRSILNRCIFKRSVFSQGENTSRPADSMRYESTISSKTVIEAVVFLLKVQKYFFCSSHMKD